MTDGNRLVRTRMPGGVGGAGSIPAPTRLGLFFILAITDEIDSTSSKPKY